MPHKVRVYLAAVAMIVAVSVPAGLLLGSPVGASTAACGTACTSPSVQSLGTGQVLTASGSGSGSSVVMAAASTTSSTQDWTPLFEGPVSGAVSAGVVSAKLEMNYSLADLEEFEYAPNGVPSDQCLANTTEQYDNFIPSTAVVLEPCGITAQSLWILDAGNASNGYLDLINAGYAAAFTYDVPPADVPPATSYAISPFAEPYVLTVNSSGKILLAPLSELGGVVSTSQMWNDWSAPVQAAMRAAVARSRVKMDRFR